MSHIRFAILGAGGIANQFASALRETEDADLVAVASKSQERADAFAQRHGIPDAYDSYAAMLARDDIDVVYIATTHNFHRENIDDCLRAGKHVICEKPMTLTEADARACFDLAREKGLFLMEAMWTRFLPCIAQAKAWIAEGRIGELQAVDGVIGFRASNDPQHRLINPALAGGSMYDIGVYALEVISYLVGEPIEDVLSFRRDHPVTGVDARVAMLVRYPSLDATIQCLFTSNARESVTLHGTNGCISLPALHVPHRATLYGENRAEIETFRQPDGNGFRYEIAEVIRCIRAGETTSPVMPPEATIECARVFDAVLHTANA